MVEGSLGGGVRRDRSPPFSSWPTYGAGLHGGRVNGREIVLHRICSHLRGGGREHAPGGVTARDRLVSHPAHS